MNRKYVIHPRDYAIGENEKLYADMAAKGWLLVKRGRFFSRFRRDTPQKLRYRLDFASPDTLSGETELPDEQLALYEECGWHYVTGNVYIHIFSAPENSSAPEIYTDPKQQAATLKYLRRRYLFNWIPAVLLLPVNHFTRILIRGLMFNSGSDSVLDKLAGAIKFEWVAYTALILLYAFAVLWAMYAALYGTVRLAQVCRKLKRGQPIDHAPKKRYLLHRIVSAVMLTSCTVFAALLIIQIASYKKYDMPLTADGPYLLLQDLGWEGARAIVLRDHKSDVETDHSLFADHWHTYECVTVGEWRSYMYQDIYVLRDEKMAGNIVPYFMMNTIRARDASEFKHLVVAGLDEAYSSGKLEYIAVKGNTVYHITYDDPYGNTDQTAKADVLKALAEMDR